MVTSVNTVVVIVEEDKQRASPLRGPRLASGPAIASPATRNAEGMKDLCISCYSKLKSDKKKEKKDGEKKEGVVRIKEEEEEWSRPM